ncbi:MAG: peptidase, partial [Polaromonas sp.]|nr:peptidase [Polaromonas sp.]
MRNLFLRGSQGADVQRLLQRLKEALGEDASEFGDIGALELLDADAEAAVRRWQAGVGLVADGVVGPHCLSVLGLRPRGELAVGLTLAAVRRLFPATKPANIDRYLPYMAAALDAAGLADRPMIFAALGTIRAESEGFVPIAELASHLNTLPAGAPFSAYEAPKKKKDLGNTQPGDGARFKGRGFVQLTGRANYEKYGAALGISLADKPDLANAPEIAALLLARFLADHADGMREALAQADWRAARKLVNGGAHGLDRFKDVFALADEAWPPGQPVGAQAAAGPAAAPRRSLTVRKDPGDLED